MTYCPECGQSIAPTAKFCRHCGASLAEPPQPVTVPAPQSPPVSPVPPVIAPILCHVCGSPVAPEEKFCGNCGAIVGEPAPVVAEPPVAEPPDPVSQPTSRICLSCGSSMPMGMKFCGSCGASITPTPIPAPARAPIVPPSIQVPLPPPPFPAEYPAPLPPSGVRVCRVCGTPIKPGVKFCSKCCAIVPDEIGQTSQAPSMVPPPPAFVPPSSTPLCPACGSPVTGTEKFCGICGSPVSNPPPKIQPPAAPAASVGKFCGSCGAPVSASTRFCGVCGATVLAVSGTAAAIPPVSGYVAPPPPPAPAPVQAGNSSNTEEVIGVIGNARKSKMLGMSYDTFTLVVTNRRMIFAQLTQAMLTTAIKEAQAKAKAEGKGFFGIMKDQFSASFGFAIRYEIMSPDLALMETPGNFAIDNMLISGIKMKLRDRGSDDSGYDEFQMIISSANGNFEYQIANDERFINLLKSVYGERLHMPFGYFSKAGLRIKFF